jgi:hypothetical protein
MCGDAGSVVEAHYVESFSVNFMKYCVRFQNRQQP